MSPTRTLSTNEAAAFLAISRRTMLRWVKHGVLPSTQSGGGRYRIRVDDLVRLMRDQGLPVPEALLQLQNDQQPVRVAIIDDDEGVTAVLRKAVRHVRADAEVRIAVDGFTGGLLVSEMRPHVLLLDVVMPGLDGTEVLRRIHERQDLSEVSVLIISGHLNASLEAQLQELGAAEILRKPIDLKTLRAALRRYLPPRGTHGPASGP